MKILIWLLALIFTAPVLAQSLYRWVDKEGKVHYTDEPPPADAKSSQEKRFSTGPTSNPDQWPFIVKDAVDKNPVVVYLTDCGQQCSDARALLARRGVPHTVRNPQNSAADAEALRKAVGKLEVPVLMVGTRAVSAFSESSWNAALDGGGYPKANPFTKAPEPKKSGDGQTAPAAQPAAPGK